jgi:hypothetical protein
MEITKHTSDAALRDCLLEAEENNDDDTIIAVQNEIARRIGLSEDWDDEGEIEDWIIRVGVAAMSKTHPAHRRVLGI